MIQKCQISKSRGSLVRPCYPFPMSTITTYTGTAGIFSADCANSCHCCSEKMC